jgi:hypothetical protein
MRLDSSTPNESWAAQRHVPEVYCIVEVQWRSSARDMSQIEGHSRAACYLDFLGAATDSRTINSVGSIRVSSVYGSSPTRIEAAR